MPDPPVFLLTINADGRWHPGIGDPTFLGWSTVACYFAASVLCIRAWRTERAGTEPSGRTRPCHPVFWLGLAGTLMLLGINKQLDLQTWFTQAGRAVVKSAGWYGQHRTLQARFVAGVAGLGLCAALGTLWHLRRARWNHHLAAVGLVFLVGFIVIRAASFHHVDHLLGVRLASVRVNVILEIGGLLLIGTAAAVR